MNTIDVLFSWFTDATVRGTLLALAVLAIQAALRTKLPAQWRYALWLPVVFVLVSPWLPQSRWSLENSLSTNQPENVAVINTASHNMNAETAMPLVDTAQPSPVRRVDSLQVAGLVWAVGVGAFLCVALVAYARTLRSIRRASGAVTEELSGLLKATAAEIRLRRAPDILLSQAVQSPAVTGLLRPLLLLPADFSEQFSREEARLVLLHEFAHIKRGDLPLNWLLCFLQAIHWCNPILWFVFLRIRADREAACDAHVLALASGPERGVYGHALLKLETAGCPSGFSLGFVGIFERTAGIRTRIRRIAMYRGATPAWNILGLAFVAVVALAGATRAQTETPQTPLFPQSDSGARNEIAVQPPADTAAKLNRIILPKLDFREATVEEALAFLQAKSAQHDIGEKDIAKRGVKFVLNRDVPVADPVPGLEPAPSDARITVSLSNIPLIESLKYVTSLANLKYRVHAGRVEVVPVNAIDPLLTKEWKLGPDSPDLGSNPKEALAAVGVFFPDRAAAAIAADGRRLIMRNTAENIAMVDALMAAGRRPQNIAEGSAPIPGAGGTSRSSIDEKLDRIIFPKISFRDATLSEALDFLKKKSAELDTAEQDPLKRGVNFVLNVGRASALPQPAPIPGIPGLDAPSPSVAPPPPGAAQEPRVTISLQNIPLREVIKYITNLANMKFSVEQHAVSISPQ